MHEKVGKVLGGISSFLAIGIALFLLFGPMYSFQSGDSEGNFETGTASAFELALAEGDRAVFFGASFVVVVSIVGAIGALANRVGWVWGSVCHRDVCRRSDHRVRGGIGVTRRRPVKDGLTAV